MTNQTNMDDIRLSFDRLMDNAACACQERSLLDSESVREAVKLNIFDPLMAEIERWKEKGQHSYLDTQDGTEECGRCGHNIRDEIHVRWKP